MPNYGASDPNRRDLPPQPEDSTMDVTQCPYWDPTEVSPELYKNSYPMQRNCSYDSGIGGSYTSSTSECFSPVMGLQDDVAAVSGFYPEQSFPASQDSFSANYQALMHNSIFPADNAVSVDYQEFQSDSPLLYPSDNYTTASVGSQFPFGPATMPKTLDITNTMELEKYYDATTPPPCFEGNLQQDPPSPSQSKHASTSQTCAAESGSRKWQCLYPGCTQKPFTRSADLERHVKMLHVDDQSKDSWFCDYEKCPRRNTPFHRRDHYRDHLRDYHKEDLLKRAGHSAAGSGSGARSGHSHGAGGHAKWVPSKNVNSKWWRCGKCLLRVKVKDGFKCPTCETQCEPERQKAREAKAREEAEAARQK